MNSPLIPPSPRPSAHAGKVDLESIPQYARFAVRGKGTHAFIKTIIERNRTVTVWQKRGQEFFLATLLGMDTNKNLLYIERSQHELAWQANMSGGLLCSTDVDRVQIQFSVGEPARGTYNTRLAWVVPLPDSLVRLQRREYFRLDVPKGKPCICRVSGITAFGCQPEARCELQDISIGGMSFLAHPNMFNAFTRGTAYRRCEVKLPDTDGSIMVDFKVCSTQSSILKSGARLLRVGVEFQKLSNADHHRIQHFITLNERERHAVIGEA